MGERNDFMDKQDEVMLPGFRFHPTDEELVAFYLKRKIQQKPLTIELIRQLDIYKFDPWDLPKLAASGEKEWYFYCPRDRKYRNSTRPNRVTGAGFWKATGTDRPIYSSEGTKCIGLKKSLVFYKGRAAKGIKTDWMMHEFRLPPLTDSSLQKRPTEQTIPANDAWAICRIFKKTNSMAQKELYHSWVPPLLKNNETDMFSISQSANVTHFGSENMSSTSSEAGSIQFGCSNGMQQQGITLSYPPLDVTSYKPITMINYKPSLLPISNEDIPTNFMFSPAELSVPSKCSADLAAMLLNLSPAILGDEEKVPAIIDFGQPNQCNIPDINLGMDMNGHCGSGQEDLSVRKTEDIGIFNNQWGNTRTVNFPFNISPSLSDDWKPALPWDSPPCPSDMSTSYSTNKPFT